MNKMTFEQVLDEIKMLAHSQGYYGRLYESIKDLKKESPEGYQQFKEAIESKGFTSALDIVMYFEG